jgi:hypothetical protein
VASGQAAVALCRLSACRLRVIRLTIRIAERKEISVNPESCSRSCWRGDGRGTYLLQAPEQVHVRRCAHLLHEREQCLHIPP